MKPAICNFCRRSFRNTQAVRAHLKACPAYGRLPKATLPRVGNKPRTVSAPDRDPGVHSPWEDVLRSNLPRPQAVRIVAGTGQRANLSGLARWMIQSVKDKVIGSWWSPGHTIPSETKAEALVAIDQELSRLPVDQLPRSELVTIAEGSAIGSTGRSFRRSNVPGKKRSDGGNRPGSGRPSSPRGSPMRIRPFVSSTT
jgi:hypothetical protein